MLHKPPKFVVNCSRVKRTQVYEVSFPFNGQLIDRIKALPKEDRAYMPNNRTWHVKAMSLFELIKSYKKSSKIHFEFGEDRDVFKNLVLKKEMERREKERKLREHEENNKKWLAFKYDVEKNYKKHWDCVHKNLKDFVKLYPYQVAGTAFTNEVRNVLLSLEMGLGKTLVSIAYVEMNDFNKVFVITPNSLKYNYYNEVEKFTDSKAHIVNKKDNKYTIEESKYIIVNYDYFNPADKRKVDKKFKKLNIGKIDVIICDESHKLKNTKSNTYKNFKRMFKDVPSKVFLSGTPAPNRAKELYTILNQIAPLEFPRKGDFEEQYCGLTYDVETGGKIVTQKTRLEELFHKLEPYTYRKRKDEVLKDLPDKIYQKIILELDNRQQKIYDDIEEGVANEIFSEEELSGANILTIMLRLRQFTSQIKVSYIKELIDRLLEEDEKIVIVDMFKDVLYEIHKIYPEISAVHTGDQTVDERQAIVKDFQDPNGKIKIFLGSIQTCNYGLTLTAANKMFIMTLPFSVGEYDQVADRLHRIGQKDTVNIYPLVFLQTIDEYVFGVIEDKRAEIMKAIDNLDYESDVSESVLHDVLDKLRKKYGK